MNVVSLEYCEPPKPLSRKLRLLSLSGDLAVVATAGSDVTVAE